MLDASALPEWVQIARLILTVAVTIGLGISAFDRHKRESDEIVSARRWMYWLYSIAFLGAGVANFASLWVTIAFGTYQKATFHIGYFTFLLVLSYLAVLAGVRRGDYR